MARSPENACHGKVRYETRSQATEWARTMTSEGIARSPGLYRTYRCPFCNHFHLGNARGHTKTAKSFGTNVFRRRSRP